MIWFPKNNRPIKFYFYTQKTSVSCNSKYTPIQFGLIIFMILLALYSCQDNHSRSLKSYETHKSFSRSLQQRKIVLDSIVLDSIQSSFDGSLFVEGNQLNFVDRRFGWIYGFDPLGKLKNRVSVRINGVDDIKSHYIQFYYPLPDGTKFIVGSKNDCYLYSKDYKVIKSYILNWQTKSSPAESMVNYIPDNPGLYMPLYNICPPAAMNSKILYFPVASQHPQFNQSAKEFYEKASIAAKYNIDQERVDAVVGAYPKNVTKDNTKWLISFPSIAASDDNVFLTFGSDSMIYKTDKDLVIQEQFGCAGNNVQSKFLIAKDIYEIRPKWKKDFLTKGFYNSLYYDRTNELLFRTYNSNVSTRQNWSGGVQIYQDNQLIGQAQVPRNFKVRGFIAPYYYSEAFIDDIKGVLKVYRFKIL